MSISNGFCGWVISFFFCCLFISGFGFIHADSMSFTPYAITKVLDLGARFIDGQSVGVNDKQNLFLSDFCKKNDIQLLNKSFLETELFGKASFLCSDVNQFLQEHGFSIQLQEVQTPKPFYVAAIQHVIAQWLSEGSPDIISIFTQIGDERLCKQYQAVCIDKNTNKMKNFEVFGDYQNPILCMYTKTGDLVYMMSDSQKNGPSDEFDLYAKIKKICEKEIAYKASGRWDDFVEAIFPLVSLTQSKSLSWILGLEFISTGSLQDPYNISQALCETQFKMDARGVEVKCAVTCSGECMDFYVPTLVVEPPLYLWIERPGVSNPYFYAYIDEDSLVVKEPTIEPVIFEPIKHSEPAVNFDLNSFNWSFLLDI